MCPARRPDGGIVDYADESFDNIEEQRYRLVNGQYEMFDETKAKRENRKAMAQAIIVIILVFGALAWTL